MGAGHLDRIKAPWSAEEDEVLQRLVFRLGTANWSLISRSIPGRSGMSCRRRWCSQIPPGAEHRPFTAAEDEIIAQSHAVHGKKWATISRLLAARTGHSIRDRWESTLKWKSSSRIGGGGSAGKSRFGPASSDSDSPASQRIDASSETEDPLTRLCLSLPGTESDESSSN